MLHLPGSKDGISGSRCRNSAKQQKLLQVSRVYSKEKNQVSPANRIQFQAGRNSLDVGASQLCPKLA
jgi:hypothetical protein